MTQTPRRVAALRVKIFADGAKKEDMLEMASKPHIRGLTTNPTLMKKAGISDYRAFAKSVLEEIRDKPISFEVFSDDFAEMERQADVIASWGDNVYVKIPVTNTKREPAYDLIERLTRKNIKLNLTALAFTGVDKTSSVLVTERSLNNASTATAVSSTDPQLPSSRTAPRSHASPRRAGSCCNRPQSR